MAPGPDAEARGRIVPLEGCLNFRDLGGYPTAEGRRLRWGCVYRSDSLHALTPGDLDRLETDLRIRDVVDLRTPGERAAEPVCTLGARSLRLHLLPLYDGTEGGGRRPPSALDHLYFQLLRHRGDRVAGVLSTIADATAPLVFHCAAGKDRTGVVAAALLGLLGVAEELIVADYALTRRNLEGIVARLEASTGYREMADVLPPDTLHAEPDTMRALLERVRGEWGDLRGWARAAGLSDASVERLRQRLLA